MWNYVKSFFGYCDEKKDEGARHGATRVAAAAPEADTVIPLIIEVPLNHPLAAWKKAQLLNDPGNNELVFVDEDGFEANEFFMATIGGAFYRVLFNRPTKQQRQS